MRRNGRRRLGYPRRPARLRRRPALAAPEQRMLRAGAGRPSTAPWRSTLRWPAPGRAPSAARDGRRANARRTARATGNCTGGGACRAPSASQHGKRDAGLARALLMRATPGLQRKLHSNITRFTHRLPSDRVGGVSAAGSAPAALHGAQALPRAAAGKAALACVIAFYLPEQVTPLEFVALADAALKVSRVVPARALLCLRGRVKLRLAHAAALPDERIGIWLASCARRCGR